MAVVTVALSVSEKLDFALLVRRCLARNRQQAPLRYCSEALTAFEVLSFERVAVIHGYTEGQFACDLAGLDLPGAGQPV